jgi:hypothetical protein
LAEQEIKQIGEGESPAEYTRERAIQSFQQIVEIHGWQVMHHLFHVSHGPSFAATDSPLSSSIPLSLCQILPAQNAPEFPGGAAKKKP